MQRKLIFTTKLQSCHFCFESERSMISFDVVLAFSVCFLCKSQICLPDIRWEKRNVFAKTTNFISDPLLLNIQHIGICVDQCESIGQSDFVHFNATSKQCSCLEYEKDAIQVVENSTSSTFTEVKLTTRISNESKRSNTK